MMSTSGHSVFTVATSALLALGAACTSSSDDNPDAAGAGDQFALAQSDLPRETAPQVPAADQEQLASGNTAFALDLYAQVRGQSGNLFFSPYSISAALAMTYAGAQGQTETEMAEALHFGLPQSQLHAAFNHLDLELESRAETEPDEDTQPFRLNIANSIWGQQDYHFETPFLDTLAVNYGAGLRLLDFIADPEGAREAINAWVSQQTEERIPELLAEGTIQPDIRLVLTNAIYFTAAWASPFEPENTQAGSFWVDGSNEVTVDMMVQTESFPYVAGTGFQAVALPYDGRQLSMLVLVPDAGQMAQFESQLTADRVAEVVAGLESTNLALEMPKFEYDSDLSLRETLAAMGMTTAFDPSAADFSGMTGGRDLFIDDVIHQAYVLVDEEGTEAAAATAVLMAPTSAPPPPVPLSIDRPFVFLIRDEPTGAILFLGRVTDPR